MSIHSMAKRLALLSPLFVLAGCEAPTRPASNSNGLSSALASQSAPVVNENLLHIIAGPFNWVVDADGNETTDPEALLFFRDPLIPGDPLKPLLAPDGHQVTLGEYTAVEGRTRVKCVQKGTKLVVHLSGLFPKGLYTLWLALWDPAFDPGADLAELITRIQGLGAAGPADGSQNAFRASASGEGQVTLTISPGQLSLFGEVTDPCLFDDSGVAQWHIVGAYHVDDQTHGGDPGPRVEPFLFIFDND